MKTFMLYIYKFIYYMYNNESLFVFGLMYCPQNSMVTCNYVNTRPKSLSFCSPDKVFHSLPHSSMFRSLIGLTQLNSCAMVMGFLHNICTYYSLSQFLLLASYS